MSSADAAPVFTSMLHAIDARDWKAVRDSFDTEIDIDYSSLFGEPVEIPGIARERIAAAAKATRGVR